jgi:hypothetical protein
VIRLLINFLSILSSVSSLRESFSGAAGDIHLSKDIKNHAKHLIGSEGESSVAAAGMVVCLLQTTPNCDVPHSSSNM